MNRGFVVAIFGAVVLLLAAQTNPHPTKSKSTKSAEGTYDPFHLSPGEVACGRPGLKPCHCLKVRQDKLNALADKCSMAADGKEMKKCLESLPACKDVHVVDQDEAWQESAEYSDGGESMPPQCSRSCSKSRCECCRT